MRKQCVPDVPPPPRTPGYEATRRAAKEHLSRAAKCSTYVCVAKPLLQTSINGKCVQQSLQPKHHHMYIYSGLQVACPGAIVHGYWHLSRWSDTSMYLCKQVTQSCVMHYSYTAAGSCACVQLAFKIYSGEFEYYSGWFC